MVLHRFDSSDQIRNHNRFRSDEVAYNLIHRICESPTSLCIKSSEDTMMFAQTKGNNAWLWIAGDIEEYDRASLIQELTEVIKGIPLPGISGEPEIAALFAQWYGNARGLQSYTSVLMESYDCQSAIKPLYVAGALHKATSYDAGTVAAYLAGFSEYVHGTPVEHSSQLQAAQDMIKAGHLYLWLVEGEAVSMANIAHRTARHARINAVYTPAAYRKRGYASRLVAELCSILASESLIPMLYADLSNPDSNKVYKKIGFVERGTIADRKFKPLD